MRSQGFWGGDQATSIKTFRVWGLALFFNRNPKAYYGVPSQPGRPCSMRAAFFTGLIWP